MDFSASALSFRPSLLLGAPLLSEAMDPLTLHCDLTMSTELDPQCFAQHDAAITTLNQKLDADFFRSLPSEHRLRIIANYAVGYDNIDVKAAQERGIWVSNTPDVLTEATAELALALLLSLSRRIVPGDRWVKAGTWTGWTPTQLLGRGLKHKVLGIVGAGRIGQATAALASAHGMSLLYTARTPKKDFEQRTGAVYLSLEALCRQSDMVSIHLPGGADTEHLFNESLLRSMKPEAYLVNTGRGSVIDEQALIACLQSGHLAGAALDVFEREPEVPEALRSLSQVVLTPHIGSATREARLAMAAVCWQNVVAALGGQTPPQQVNGPLGPQAPAVEGCSPV
jgi:glyoxylate reductase